MMKVLVTALSGKAVEKEVNGLVTTFPKFYKTEEINEQQNKVLKTVFYGEFDQLSVRNQ